MSPRAVWWMGSIGLIGMVASVCYCTHLAGKIGVVAFGVPWLVACYLDATCAR